MRAPGWLGMGGPREVERFGVKGREEAWLVVVAHPDDESMFFAPTILALPSYPWATVRILCLSTGDFRGGGGQRTQEMVAACAALGVGADAVEVVDDPRLRDGPGTNWLKEAVAERVSTAVERWGISKVLTFDAAGASGHANHVATYRGVRHFLARRPELQGWVLETVGPVMRFTGWLGAAAAALAIEEDALLHVTPKFLAPQRAMLCHQSQLAWFRWLYMATSVHMCVNVLVRLR